MDLRLILDGGAAPPAPPGKGIESPPPPEEFEKTLQQAKKGDENPGEVAETEPNAPLQKLDSKEKEAGKDIPVDVLVEQAVTVPVQFTAIPIIAALQDAVAPTFVVDSSKACNTENATATTPTPVVSTPTLPVFDSKKVLNQGESTTDSNAPAKDELGILVASLMTKKPTNFTIAQPKGEGTADAKTPEMPVSTEAVAIAEQTMPKEITKDLNVVSVQAVSNAVVAEQVAATQPKGQTLTGAPTGEVTGTVPAGETEEAEGTFKNDGKIVPLKATGISGIEHKNDGKIVPLTNKADLSGLAGRLAGEAGQEESAEGEKKDDSTMAVVDIQSTPAPSAGVKSTPVENTQALTTAQRQKVVDTLTQKIEELSVKSVRNEVRVEMQPAELGSVIVNVRKDLAGLTATLNASNEPLRQALHESRNDLAGALAGRNVGQVRIEVRGASADTMNMGQQFNQAQSQNQNHQQQQQSRQAAANLAALNREPMFAGAAEQKAAPRRLSTTALDLEI